MLSLSKCVCGDNAMFVRALTPRKSNPASSIVVFQVLCENEACRKGAWKKTLPAAATDWNEKIKLETKILEAMAKVK